MESVGNSLNLLSAAVVSSSFHVHGMVSGNLQLDANKEFTELCDVSDDNSWLMWNTELTCG